MTLNAHYIGANNFQNSVNSDRKMVEFMVMGSAAVSGVTPNSFTVSPVAGQHQVTVGVAGSRAFVMGKNTPATQGAYHAWADGPELVNLPAPQSNPFIATVILRVTDPQYGTVTGLVGARIDVVSGTPASSPLPISDAAIDAISGAPGGWTRLADVRINTTDTGAIPVGQITDARTYLPDRAGDPLNVLSTARPAGVLGRTIYERDTGRTRIYNGTDWWQVSGPPVELAVVYNGSSGIIGPGTGASIHPQPFRLFKVNKTCYAVGGWKNPGGTLNVGTNIQQPWADLPAAAVPVLPDAALTGTARRLSFPALLNVGGVGFNIATFIVAPDTNQLMFQPGRDLNYGANTVQLNIGLVQWETAVQS